MRLNILRTKWRMTDDPTIPDGAYTLDVPITHIRSFLREFGIRLWFIPAHLPKDPRQVLVSVEEEVGIPLGCCRYAWIVLDIGALDEARNRECATFYVFNREDLVAYTDAPLF